MDFDKVYNSFCCFLATQLRSYTMKKSALALAVAATLGVAGVSQAETTLYGSARVSLDWVKPDVDSRFARFFGIDGGSQYWEVVNNSSRLGVRGSEDLGNGLSAIYQYEFGVDVTGDRNYFNSNRPRWVGLKGGWGAVTMGTQWTPYYNVIGIQDTLNSGKSFNYYLAGDRSADGIPVLIRKGRAEFRVGNSIVYSTPNWRGLSSEVMLEMNGLDGPNSLDRWELNLTYENGPLFVGGAFFEHEESDDKQYAVALGWLSEVWGVTASWQQYKPDDEFQPFVTDSVNDCIARDDAIGTSTGQVFCSGQTKVNDYTLQGSYTFGNNVLRGTFSYQKADDFDGDAQYYELGFDHFFSKRTRLWAESYWFVQDLEDVDALQDIQNISVDDSKKWAISLGIRHDF
jgi:predicted porin